MSTHSALSPCSLSLSGSESPQIGLKLMPSLFIFTLEKNLQLWRDGTYANHNTLGQLTNQSQGILYFGKRGFIEIGVSDLARLGREVL